MFSGKQLQEELLRKAPAQTGWALAVVAELTQDYTEGGIRPTAYRLLAHDELLNLLHLGHVVLIGLQFSLTDPLIDPD